MNQLLIKSKVRFKNVIMEVVLLLLVEVGKEQILLKIVS